MMDGNNTQPDAANAPPQNSNAGMNWAPVAAPPDGAEFDIAGVQVYLTQSVLKVV